MPNRIPHQWVEVTRHDGVHGFYCRGCELFVKFNSTREMTGCAPK